MFNPFQRYLMMLAKAEAGKKSSEGSDNHKKLLKDVETISKVLYPDENSYKNSASTAISQSKSTKIFPLPDPKSKPKASVDDKSVKDKKSIWNWKRLKALSINHSRKFNCCFSIQVHLIEGLPLSFNDASLRVYWKRQDEVMVTHPAKVIQCTAEFEEILNHTCSISGSRSAPHNSAKYEAKHVLLYASVVGAPELDLGKHRVDLARLLPLTLEELEEEKSSGKWTTSFRLSGAARGATMNVSFGYVVVGDNTSASRDNYIAPNALTLRQNSMAALMKSGIKFRQSDGSLPSNTNQYSYQNVDEVKDLHEVLPLSRSKLASSVEALYKKLDEEKTFSPLQNEPKEIEVFTKDCKPIKVDACSLSDSGKAKPEELLGIEGKTCSPMHVKPECEVCEENVETVKLDCYPSPDSGKGNREAEEWESNKGKTHSPIHDKLEFDLLQENAETVKPEGYPSPDSGKEKCEEYEGNGFSVFDQGTELSSNEHIKLEEPIIKALVHAHTVDSTCWIDTSGIRASFEDSDNHDSLDDVNVSSKEKAMVHEFFYKENNICSKEHLLQELESALNTVSDLESVTFDCPDIMEVKSECEMRKSHSLDDFTESVASEFLSMLGIDHSPVGLSSESEPESPRERLLRQFEKDALSEGFSLYDFGTDSDNEDGNHSDASFGSEQWKFSDGIKSPSLLEDLQEGHFIQSRDVKSKIKAQMLQDMEAEALMREWGLNEKSSQHSPPKDSTGYGSLIHLQITEPHILPPLPEELGPFTRTKDGGFLRSMNPSLFRNAKGGGNLIMQVFNPVRIEKLSMQPNKLMPLEDVTGKNIQQIAWESIPVLQGTESRQCHLQHDLVTVQDSTCVEKDLKGTLSKLKSIKFSSCSVGNQTGKEFVSLDDLALLAMDQIEALSKVGLRIQSRMSEEDESSNITAQSVGEILTLQSEGVNISWSLARGGAAALQLLDLKDSSGGVDGVIGLSLTLDEWMRIDSGEFDDDKNSISEQASKVLTAHHANNSFDLIHTSSEGERKQCKGPARKCGLLGNNFTVELMVQLRDPMRNYEPLGTPMLSIVQVGREFVPPKQRIYSSVYEAANSNDGDDECEIVTKMEMKEREKGVKFSEEKGIPQSSNTKVHVAGLKTKPHKNKVRGSSSQQQSGSRWLLANGMGKINKHPLMKSKAATW
ncbi:unnamed protein product [Lupinus luteus]|uniref:C2 NT-type domain-containing protein n=1 Tax=Lupinus luteus TaxID=3873 RepID=A0AAV1XWU6_LUPLU